jgi:serine/threonine protein kinase
LIVQRLKDRKQLVAKVNTKPEERQILEFLHSREPPSEYVIPLIGSFPSNMGPGILLPIRRSVLPLLAHPGEHRSRFLQFAEDLIKGLAFLHRHYVAHRDIKPDNLVYTDAFLLQIIDFDVATRVFDTDLLLDEDVGTEGYKAPETQDVYGRPNPHSPILADRWSCGFVILRFLGYSNQEGRQHPIMEHFARRLMDEDPERRPSLCEWFEPSKRTRGTTSRSWK